MDLEHVPLRVARTRVEERTRVVIVEDDPHQLRALTRILRRHRESVDASLFNNGRAALLDAETTRPRLVVMDVFMPGLDGLEVCRRIKANPVMQDTRVVLTSGRMTSDVKAAALKAGAAHVLEKPFDLATLLEQVAHSGSFARGSQPAMLVPEMRAMVKGNQGGETATIELRDAELREEPSVRRRARAVSDRLPKLGELGDLPVPTARSERSERREHIDLTALASHGELPVISELSELGDLSQILSDVLGELPSLQATCVRASSLLAPEESLALAPAQLAQGTISPVVTALSSPVVTELASAVGSGPVASPTPALSASLAPALDPSGAPIEEMIAPSPASSQVVVRDRRQTTVQPPRRAAGVLVDMLAAAGVDVVFGLPGGAISPVHDALLDSNIRVVTTRHESGATFAAAGYAHITGRLGVCAVTSGPGALNALTGVASAWCDGLPMLLLVGEVPRKAHGRGVLQDGSAHGLKIVEMAAHISKLAVEVPDAAQLPHLLRRAIVTALSGRRGPVVLTLPMDVTSAMITPPRMEGHLTVRGQLSSELVDEVRDILRDANRPMILAGSGLRGNGAPALLRRVAERLRCPVATTPKAKGVFPEDHPLSLGVLGLGGHLSSRGYLESGVDAVIVLGSSLGDLSTDGFNPALQAPVLIHVDIDGRQIGKSYAPTHAVVADIAEFLDALDLRLGSEACPQRDFVATGVVRHQLPATADSEPRIGPHEVLREIQSLLPADTVYTVDSGEHFTFATHYLQIVHSDAYVVMTGLGSMGQSIGAAIGVKLAQPERSVAAIVGDGCFAMNAFEVATAVAQRLPIRVFVFNDNRLGMVENGHEHVYGRRPDYSTGSLDVCAIAAGLGAATVRVCRPGDLAGAARLLASYPGPVVVDVQIDPRIRLPKKDRMAAFAPPPRVSADEPGVN
jgi:acetolactate synthase I/II/III large subunit